MSNSALVDYIKYSPNHGGQRTRKITGMAIHHTAGVLSVETLANIFMNPNRYASSNYGIGYDGRISLMVDEVNKAWTTSSDYCDQQKVTVEVSNSVYGNPWLVSDHVLEKLIQLTTDVHYRNGLKEVTYTGDERGTIWIHKWFSATACPGEYLESKLPYVAKESNRRLQILLKGNVKPSAKPTKPISEIVKEVIRGKYGNYPERKTKLESLGYNYNEVQSEVDKVMGKLKTKVTTSKKKSNEEVARLVIQGKYGNGQARVDKLKAEGYDPHAIQTIVNRLLNKKTVDQVAHEVLQGKWGNGQDRKNRLIQAGYSYDEVQAKVNKLLGY